LERYGKEPLVDILNDRIVMAFEPAAVSEDVVSLVAELASAETGNARFAIELLWRSGKYADAEDAKRVEPECVRQAVSSIIPTLKRSELENLGFHEKMLLLATARYFKENEEAYATLAEIEKDYAVICEEFEEKPYSHTQVWKYIQRFDSLGILKAEIATAATRGRTTRISLPSIPAVELEKQLSALLKED
jgi:cell division control protein 6